MILIITMTFRGDIAGNLRHNHNHHHPDPDHPDHDHYHDLITVIIIITMIIGDVIAGNQRDLAVEEVVGRRDRGKRRKLGEEYFFY